MPTEYKILRSMQRTFKALDAAQARVDAKSAQYERIRVPLSDAFLTGQIDYAAYIRRSQRLNARFKRELDRIHL